jgi:ABC-type sugar transport system ATPase subunit
MLLFLSDIMLIITNLTKHFKGNFAATLQGINLQLSAGEFCILVGDNGSGKSTLLSCISGEYQFDEGNINIDKRKVYCRRFTVFGVRGKFTLLFKLHH